MLEDHARAGQVFATGLAQNRFQPPTFPCGNAAQSPAAACAVCYSAERVPSQGSPPLQRNQTRCPVETQANVLMSEGWARKRTWTVAEAVGQACQDPNHVHHASEHRCKNTRPSLQCAPAAAAPLPRPLPPAPRPRPPAGAARAVLRPIPLPLAAA